MTKEFNPIEMVEAAIASDLDGSFDNSIDESSIKKAANWFEFCTGPDYMNVLPFPRQVQMALKFLGEYCPRCSTPGYIDNLFGQSMSEIKKNIKMLEFGVCPACQVTQSELFRNGELGEFNELDVCCGRRAGKTVFTSLIAAYHLHRILTLKNPARYFRVMNGQTLCLLFVAITKTQAEDTVWQAFKDRIEKSPWFRAYHSFLDAYARENGLDHLYEAKKTFLHYYHKNIKAEVVTPNIKTIRGRTTVMTSIDELAWIDAGSDGDGIVINPEETHNALAQSNQSVRSAAMKMRHKERINNVPTGIDVNISSPASANDMIMRLVRSSSTKKSVCAFHYATWEVNPNVPYESLESDRLANYKIFMRDFGAVPPMANSAFMDEEPSVLRAIRKGKSNLLGWSTCREKDETGVETMWLSCQPRVREKSVPRILGIDPGESNNSFSLVLASLEKDVISIDGVLECQPEKLPNGETTKINFPRMFDQCILPILASFNVKLVVSDHWQSADMTQRLRSDHKTKSETYTLRYDDFLGIRTAWYDGRVAMPQAERSMEEFKRTTEQLEDFVRGFPALKLAIQAMTVREVGRKIVKPQLGSDDIFRAACLCAHFLLDPELNRPFMYAGIGQALRGPQRALGAVRSNRGGSAPVQAGPNNIGARKRRIDPYGLVRGGGGGF